MKTIDIAQLLSPDLKSRMRAQDLKQLVENSETDAVVFDFSNVKFATRSFIDEFYNLFLKHPEAIPYKVEITNVPEDIAMMLEAVSRTQIRAKVIPSQMKEIIFKDVNDFLHYISSIDL